jgi:putative ABC transport system permease protein
MYNLYLKIAARYLIKHKLYTFINIAGLAIGIASFILIMIAVNYEYSYDKFEDSDRVQRVYMDYLEGNTFVSGDAMTYNSTGPTLEREYPEIVNFARFYYLEKVTFVLGDKILEQPLGSMADPTVFDVFDYSLQRGDESTALSKPNTIVLTESLAKKMYGNEDPIGKTLSVFADSNETLLIVTGIMDDVPQNSHFKNTYLISFSTENNWDLFEDNERELNWSMNNYYTYIKLDRDVDATLLRQKIMENDIEGSLEERHNIEAIEDIHLHSNKPYEVEANGSITRTKFLTTIAFIIIILSWLNYINLNTTKSLERAKEIGIRKVVGALRSQLVLQLLIESIILNLISLIIAVVLAVTILPIYSNFIGIDLSLSMSDIPNFLPILGVIFMGMLLAGLYPALLVSSYSPLKALKGKVRASANGLNIRKVLIISQFLVTIMLLTSTMVITKQIRFLKNQPLGTDLNQIIAIKGEILDSRQDSILQDNFDIMENELKSLPFVTSTSSAETYPGDSYDNLSATRGIILPNGALIENNIFYTYAVHPNYFELIGIDFVAGNTFLTSATGGNNTVIVNEKFVKEMGLNTTEAILNKNLKFWGNDYTVVGVIKDYHHFGLKEPINSMIIRNSNDFTNLLVKLDASATSSIGFNSAVEQIKTEWNNIFPQSTFNYTFLDKKFEAQYNDERKFGIAFLFFTLIAIFIASLGLFGLTSYTCIQRRKEIGIRKVNGATIAQILKLLNIDFVKWVGIAFVIALPLSYYVMGRWLEDFAYKTTLSWWIFVLAGIAALLITLITVSWQSYQAATKNPVAAIREQ